MTETTTITTTTTTNNNNNNNNNINLQNYQVRLNIALQKIQLVDWGMMLCISTLK